MLQAGQLRVAGLGHGSSLRYDEEVEAEATDYRTAGQMLLLLRNLQLEGELGMLSLWVMMCSGHKLP